MNSTFRYAVAVGLFVLHFCAFIAGCGTSQPAKTKDPDKVEEQMKEYRDISKKERSG